jgi:hypothetical protein
VSARFCSFFFLDNLDCQRICFFGELATPLVTTCKALARKTVPFGKVLMLWPVGGEVAVARSPLLFFSPLAEIPGRNHRSHPGEEPGNRVKDGSLHITGVAYRRYAQITIIVIIVLGFTDFEIGQKPTALAR